MPLLEDWKTSIKTQSLLKCPKSEKWIKTKI